MDLKNKALLEAFNKKYSGIETDQKDLERFARKYYELDKEEELSFFEKAKRLGKATIDVNVGRATGDTKRMMSGYKYLNE
jgi:hypothetical protein